MTRTPESIRIPPARIAGCFRRAGWVRPGPRRRNIRPQKGVLSWETRRPIRWVLRPHLHPQQTPVSGERPERIGIELFGTQTASRHRGIGRYSRNLVTTLLAHDPINEYVLYGQYGMPTDLFPGCPECRRSPAAARPATRREVHADAMEQHTATNPDRLDALLLLNPIEMAPGYDLPAKPLSAIKMFAVVYDLIPLIYQEQYFRLWPGPESVFRYHQGLSRLRSYDALLAISEATRRSHFPTGYFP